MKYVAFPEIVSARRVTDGKNAYSLLLLDGHGSRFIVLYLFIFYLFFFFLNCGFFVQKIQYSNKRSEKETYCDCYNQIAYFAPPAAIGQWRQLRI
jgi:hypothetical protein